MRALIDMNLGPRWAGELRILGMECRHWSEVGDPRAPDAEVLAEARAEGRILATRDIGIPALLALTGERGPSVVLLRLGDLLDPGMPGLVARSMDSCSAELEKGAILVLEPRRSRVRLLPLRPADSP